MSAPLKVHSFTVDQYHRMGEAGIFHEDDRVELIDGQIVEMSPIGPRHAGCVNRLTDLFSTLAGSVVTLSVQNPVLLGERAEPQPDFVVLRRRADGYAARHPLPADVLLLIEVADTTVEWDRKVKIPLYASALIPEVWLVNLPADTIEVYRNPQGEGYTYVRTGRRDDTITPVHLPGAALRAGNILG
jgi:Uma2 family endonuclease